MEKTILTIEDSLTVRQQLKNVLEKENFKVLEAENGEKGLVVAEKENIDMFIIDVNMEGMDGLETLENIRQLDAYTKTPAFILTTESSADLVKRGKTVGATAWIVKPFNPATLLKGIRKVLGM